MRSNRTLPVATLTLFVHENIDRSLGTDDDFLTVADITVCFTNLITD